MSEYLKGPIANGSPREQALIRRWWHVAHGAKGLLVWEYYLCGRYADAVYFPSHPAGIGERGGIDAASRFPVEGLEVILCEAKRELTPELVGQGLVYSHFLRASGAAVRETVVLAERATREMAEAARALGLTVVVEPLGEE